MKKDQYQSIADLQGSLRRLFSSVNYYPEEIDIDSPKGMAGVLEDFTSSGLIVKYIDMLKEQTEQAISLSENIRQGRQKEKSPFEELECRAQLYEKQIGEQKNQVMAAEKATNGNAENALKELIGNLISFRDNQLIKRGFLYEQGEQEGSVPVRIVESILRETAGLLAKSGVKIMEDKGRFSSEHQMIIDTIETEDDELDGMIAEVVRPGYCYKGQPLRGQEVIVYKRKTKEK